MIDTLTMYADVRRDVVRPLGKSTVRVVAGYPRSVEMGTTPARA